MLVIVVKENRMASLCGERKSTLDRRKLRAEEVAREYEDDGRKENQKRCNHCSIYALRCTAQKKTSVPGKIAPSEIKAERLSDAHARNAACDGLFHICDILRGRVSKAY